MKAKFLLAGLFAAFCLFSFPGHGQDVDSMLRDTAAQLVPLAHDSVVAPAAGPILPSNNIGGIPVPAWLQTFLIALATLLPAIQLVLKKIPTPYSVRIGGVLGKILDFLTWFQKDERSASPLKIVLFLLISAALAMPAHAQGPFRPQQPLAYPAGFPANIHTRAINPITDSIVNNWRFGVSVSPAGFTLAGVYQAGAGLEFGLNHQDYNYASKTYTTLWSANIVWIPINTATPIRSIKDIATFGALYGIPKIKLFGYNVVQIGPFYDTQAPVVNGVQQANKFSNKFGVWVVANISL